MLRSITPTPHLHVRDGDLGDWFWVLGELVFVDALRETF